MASIGVGVKGDGSHAVEQLLGSGGVRIVVEKQFDLTSRFEDYASAGLFILKVYAKESSAGFNSDREALAYYRDLYARFLGAWEVGNEPDLRSDSSWTMSPKEFSRLGWDARSMMEDQILVTGGAASGWSGYLEQADIRWANGVGVHPYAKDMSVRRARVARRPVSPGGLLRANDLPDIEPLIQDYRRFGLPVWVTEWGWWGGDDRAESEVYDVVSWAAQTDLIERYFHFCLDDGMVPPFGLCDASGNLKPAGQGFLRALQDYQPIQPAPQPTPQPAYQPDPATGWVGPGLQSELDRLGWTATSGEHLTQSPLVWARTDTGSDGVIFWDGDNGRAVPYRRS